MPVYNDECYVDYLDKSESGALFTLYMYTIAVCIPTNWSTFIQLFLRPRRLKYCPETLAYVSAAYNLGLVKLIAGAHNGLTFLF